MIQTSTLGIFDVSVPAQSIVCRWQQNVLFVVDNCNEPQPFHVASLSQQSHDYFGASPTTLGLLPIFRFLPCL